MPVLDQRAPTGETPVTAARAVRRLAALVFLGALLLPTAATAHDAGEARLDIRVEGPVISIDLRMARADALDLIGLEPAQAPPDASLLPALRVAMPQWLVLEAAAPCTWRK